MIGRTGRGDYGHNLDTVWLDVPQTEVVAVADDNKLGLAEAAKRLKVERTFIDYREMLDKTRPDIVAVATRFLDQHRDMVVAAAERGIHIFLEKPLCRTLAEADEMVAACERSHAKLVIAHQTRYSPKAPVVKQLIAEGKIGRVLEYRGRGKEDARGGGEDLWVLGTHVMDLMRMLGGQPQWCFGWITQGGRPVEKAHVIDGNEGIGPLAGDSVHAMYGMPDGTVAYFSSVRNGAQGRPRFGVRIHGSAGVIDMGTNYMPSVKLLADASWTSGKWQKVSSAGVEKPEPITDMRPHVGNVLAVKDLIAAIEEQRQPKSSIYDARAAVEMIVAVFESHRLGKRVSLPLTTRQNPLSLMQSAPPA